MINKFKLNVLSFISIAFGALFVILFGRRFGASSETDVFFIANTVVIYISHFVMLSWDAVAPFYAEKRLRSERYGASLYSFLLILIVLITSFIVLIFSCLYFFGLVPAKFSESIVVVFCMYFVFYNIITLNKTILNLEGMYAHFYYSDILINVTLVLFAIYGPSFDAVMQAYVIGPFICICLQSLKIFAKLGFSRPRCSEYGTILKGSIIIKSGSLLYGLKDILILRYLSSIDEGLVSMYSYASKFAGVILQVICAPIVNVFGSKAAYWISNGESGRVEIEIKNTLKISASMFFIGVVFTYITLPFIIEFLFGGEFSSSESDYIKYMFLGLCMFNLVWIIQAPFGRIITLTRNFLLSFVSDVLFAVFLTPLLILIWIEVFDVDYLFLVACLAQSIQCVFLVYVARKYSLPKICDNLGVTK